MTKISDLPDLTGASADTDADVVPVLDMSEAGTARNKKMTFEEFAVAISGQLRITADGAVTVEVTP